MVDGYVRTKSSKEVRMKRRFPSMGVIAVLIILIFSGLPGTASAEFNVNINIGTPPVVVAEPAEVVLIPRGATGGTAPRSATVRGSWWRPASSQ
jgi:hypothetical protein